MGSPLDLTPREAAALHRLLDAYTLTETTDPGIDDLRRLRARVGHLPQDHAAYEAAREQRQTFDPATNGRPNVQPGDVVHVPRGADAVVTTPHRVLVEKISSYAISGPRIKADGTPIMSRSSITADERGRLPGVVIWETVAKSTILRGGAPVYQPPAEMGHQ